MSAISLPILRQLPPGATPPFLLVYNASSVPIIQLGLSGRDLSEQALFDYGVNFIRTRLVTIPGCAIPYPYGGKQRQIQIDLDPQALQSRGLSGQDVANALACFLDGITPTVVAMDFGRIKFQRRGGAAVWRMPPLVSVLLTANRRDCRPRITRGQSRLRSFSRPQTA